MTSHSISKPLFTLAAIALSGSIAMAQPAQPPAAADSSAPQAAHIERQTPPAPPAPGVRTMRPGMQSGRMRPGAATMMAARRDGMRGEDGGFGRGGHFGPGGIWWKNPRVVEKLTLTPDQIKRMDGVFQTSRLQLIDLRANVQKQEVMLEPLLSANPLDTAKAQGQIDKVADARAELEKSNAKMLLSIRAVLTPDQWTKLRDRGQGGPEGPGGPGRPGAGAHDGVDNLVEPDLEQ